MRLSSLMIIIASLVFLFGCTIPVLGIDVPIPFLDSEEDDGGLPPGLIPTPPPQTNPVEQTNESGNETDSINWTNLIIKCNDSSVRLVRIGLDFDPCVKMVINESCESTNLSECDVTYINLCDDTDISICDILGIDASLCNDTDNLTRCDGTDAVNCTNSSLNSSRMWIGKDFVCNKTNISFCNLCKDERMQVMDQSREDSCNVSESGCGWENMSICKIISGVKNHSCPEYDYTLDNMSNIRYYRADDSTNASACPLCMNSSISGCNITNDTNLSVDIDLLNLSGERIIVLCNETEEEEVEQEPTLTEKKALEAMFIDVGFGDATLIRSKYYTVLIDTGSASSVESMLDKFENMSVGYIDTLIISNWKEEKVGGLEELLKNHVVYEVVHNGETDLNRVSREAGRLFDKFGISESIVESGDVLYRDIFEIDIYNPQKQRYLEVDADSLAFSVAYEDFCMFFPGEIDTDLEVLVVDRNKNLRSCPIFKWRNHGDGWGESSLLFDRVGSQEVVISVGPNDLGLPSNTTLERLRIAKKNTWNTQEIDDIYVNVSRNGTYTIDTLRTLDPETGKPVASTEIIGDVYDRWVVEEDLFID